MDQLKDVANFLYEVGTMRKIIRVHRQVLLTDDMSDNIATHSFRVAVIGYFLARMEKVDWQKVTLMCLLHDMGESRTNDHNWIHKRYVSERDEDILRDQLGHFPDLFALLTEYHERKTPESIVAKDADVLDQVLLLREYAWQGNKEAQVWLDGKRTRKPYYLKYAKTRSARKLGRAICQMNPADWWKALYTHKRK